MAVIYHVKKEHALVVLSEQHKMKGGIQLMEAVKTEPPVVLIERKRDESDEDLVATDDEA